MNRETTAYLPLRFEPSDIFPRRMFEIRPDVHLTVSSGIIQAHTTRESGTTAPVFELNYNRRSCLSGEVGRVPVELHPGFATLGFLGQTQGHSEYAGGEEVRLYSIWVSPDAFDRFCEAVCGKSGAFFRSFQKGEAYRLLSHRSDAREESLLSKLDACLSGNEGVCNRLLLESHLLELLSINLEKLLRAKSHPGGAPNLTKTDLNQLDEARQILLGRLDDPPSLLELARMLRMNDFKLKRTFKECYGKTVFEFVREQRLERAFALLESGRVNVSEAAFTVGYTNVSHFSEAFRRQYGILPRELLRVACRGE